MTVLYRPTYIAYSDSEVYIGKKSTQRMSSSPVLPWMELKRRLQIKSTGDKMVLSYDSAFFIRFSDHTKNTFFHTAELIKKIVRSVAKDRYTV